MDGSRNLKKGSPFIASKIRAKRHRPMMELLPHTQKKFRSSLMKRNSCPTKFSMLMKLDFAGKNAKLNFFIKE